MEQDQFRGFGRVSQVGGGGAVWTRKVVRSGSNFENFEALPMIVDKLAVG